VSQPVAQPGGSVIAQFPRRPAAAARARAIDLGETAAFGAAVFMVLAFTQGWVMFLVGPGPGQIDPAISAQVRNVFFPVYAVALGMTVARPGATLMAAVRSPALVLLVLIAGASAIWSIDPEVTLRRSVALVFTTLSGLVIAARFGWPRFLRCSPPPSGSPWCCRSSPLSSSAATASCHTSSPAPGAACGPTRTRLATTCRSRW
jgi:hypothetical protein